MLWWYYTALYSIVDDWSSSGYDTCSVARKVDSVFIGKMFPVNNDKLFISYALQMSPGVQK